MRPAEIETEIASGRLQPKWSQVAIDEDESLVGRALWWGRDAQVPLALDVWDARRDHPDTERILIELLAHGHAALGSDGVDIPLPHTMRIPTTWRDIEAVHCDVAVKTNAAAA
ncbi:MAG TPA: GNAT family N-acetyltransferase, partial [Tetrasphaera sp.]|nr:GNAT family N-acetyltransferase [Tetrasphaera sp.]